MIMVSSFKSKDCLNFLDRQLSEAKISKSWKVDQEEIIRK